MRTGRGRVEHLHEVGGGARRGERLEHGVEHPRPTEPPEALPDGVPIPELGRQSPPSDVVNGKIMKRFQKLAVVPGTRGRVEDGRGSLGHAATPRFPSPLVKPDVRISRIRLSDWLYLRAHGGASRRNWRSS